MAALRSAEGDGIRRQALALAKRWGQRDDFRLATFFGSLIVRTAGRPRSGAYPRRFHLGSTGRLNNLLLNVNRSLLDEIAGSLPMLRGEDDEDVDEEADEPGQPTGAAGKPRTYQLASPQT
ncbi:MULTISPECIES: hypothetical protein [unclassified Bradyrhizobium]|uniref:hypothetical protein n=1 Tax=unclassified Bradyrhizobium TaxID=2631580 RepID=UPI00247AEB86|nr:MULTISPECIES: hypothetical protein [unclassified Bradyrhizobium]WGS22959.1 hypothetical protein MTX22_15685 [Bradyrhizobium sp. ISRA463]WGS29960.1 hypothetical protein MTX19_13425 [Bradyrhizobium sp. ISRA464]